MSSPSHISEVWNQMSFSLSSGRRKPKPLSCTRTIVPRFQPPPGEALRFRFRESLLDRIFRGDGERARLDPLRDLFMSFSSDRERLRERDIFQFFFAKLVFVRPDS